MLAYLSWKLVQGLYLHSAWRQPCINPEAYPEHSGCVGSYRSVARCKLEFCTVGCLLWILSFAGEICTPEGSGTYAIMASHSIHHACGYDRLGIFQPARFWRTRSLSGRYVRDRSFRFYRQYFSVLSEDRFCSPSDRHSGMPAGTLYAFQTSHQAQTCCCADCESDFICTVCCLYGL